MTANAITMSGRLEAAGLEKKTADAVASEIVDFSNEQFATKAHVAESRSESKADNAELREGLNTQVTKLEGKVDAGFAGLRAEVRMLTFWMVAIGGSTFVAVLVLVLEKLLK